MKRSVYLLLFATPLAAQLQTSNGLISGRNGMGPSQLMCNDPDGDGYGDGPTAIFSATSTISIGAGSGNMTLNRVVGQFFASNTNGSNQITFPGGAAGNYDFQIGMLFTGPGVPTNTLVVPPTAIQDNLQISNNSFATNNNVQFAVAIQPGNILTVGTGTSMERVPILAKTGNTITAVFTYPHPAGTLVKTMGCLGPDADQRDPLRWTGPQVLTLYGSMASYMAKRGNDYFIDNPIPGDTATAAAIKTSFTSPHAVWYVAPSIAVAPNTTIGSNSNSCAVVTAPCLNWDGLISKGYTSGDMVIARMGWGNEQASQAFIIPNGTAALYSILVAYPGERMNFTGGGSQSINIGSPTDYMVIDTAHVDKTSSIAGGSNQGAGSPQIHHILITHIDGMGGGSQGLASVNLFNGLQYITFQDSVLHDDDCGGGSCQHGAYWGSRDIASSFITFRRIISYHNDRNGIQFNGRCTSCVFQDLVLFSNGVTGLSLEMGVSNSTIKNILSFSNQNSGIVLAEYPGDCPSQGGADGICPYDQTGNLFENITVYQTGNTNVANPDASFGSCPTGIGFCTQAGIAVANTTSPLAGNLGSNTYRNIFVSSYGYVNHYPPIIFEDTSASCGTQCLSWLSTSTFNNITGVQTDGNTSLSTQGIFGFGPGVFGFVPYTCAAVASHTTITNCNVADPAFATEGISLWNQEASYDFRLSATSPLIHAGTATGAPTYDLSGIPYATIPSQGPLELAPNFVWKNYPTQTTLSVAPPIGGGQYSATATFAGGTATLTLSGSYFTAYGNQAIAQQQVYVSGCSVTNYNTTGTSITAFTANTISYPVSGSPASATGCTVGMSIDGNNENPGSFPICPTCTPYDYPGKNISVIHSWGSGVMTNGHKLCYMGGGHSDYGGNEFYCFDLNTFTISRLNVPSVITAQQWNASPTFYKNNDGSFASRHNFQGLTYIPTIDKIFELSGGPYGNTGSGGFGDTWLIDPATGRGTNQDPTACPTTCNFAVGQYVQLLNPSGNVIVFLYTAYDPVTQTVFSMLDPPNGFLLQYLPCTGGNASTCNSWKLISNNAPSSNCGTTTTCGSVFIDDVNRNFWLIGGGTAAYWKIDGSATPTFQPVLDASCNTLLNATGPGLYWDHADVLARSYIGVGSDQTVTNFDPQTLSCTVSTYGGDTPPLTSNPSGTFGRWQYDATFQASVWVGDYNTGASVLSPQTGCHIVPTALPSGTVNQPYSQTLTAVNCTSSTWTVSAGALPPGIPACTGTSPSCDLVGTPTQAGTFNFTLSYGGATDPLSIIIVPQQTTSHGLFLPTLIK